ncbi:SDR family oxidoreductase [Pedobacter montanisoli]|uniref:SDR family oxidoreductase n=1 Tax=Pedobacter montanisoli TaxID=2923277 RepID=A0ABS9ZWU2_9SPHI|nr:SDR family oxidoreductase [Pedobacter montanisoli]MCJ0742770.1 SDR family oxidoreductase [Pedobacter montanisoli]
MNAVITGATKGIGKAIAVELARQGYHLAICSRNQNELNLFKQELESYPINILAMQADCTQKADVINFAEKVENTFDQVDVLVNNAGIFLPQNLLDEEDENFEIQQQINVNAAYYLAKRLGKMMCKKQSGHIFNICSVASKGPVKGAGSYSVTKAALLSLNNVLRDELAQHNIKVTAILPGSTLTASWEGTTISPEKFVQPQDIAQLITCVLNLSKGVNVDEIMLTPLNF